MPSLAPTEIRALARIIGDIDYYQLLDLRRDAVSGEVKRAYHATTRMFHPDANRHLDADLQDSVGLIAKRVSEAYSVLRNPRTRQAYDRRLQEGGDVRIRLAEAEKLEARANQDRGGRTPQGKQFYKLAQRDLDRQDFTSAARNLQTALTFEPDNEVFRERLADVKERLR